MHRRRNRAGEDRAVKCGAENAEHAGIGAGEGGAGARAGRKRVPEGQDAEDQQEGGQVDGAESQNRAQ